MVITGVQTEV